MKRAPWILVIALTLSLTGLALAGDQGKAAAKNEHYAKKKCEGKTQDCLDAMAAKLRSKGWLGIETEATDDGHYKVAKIEKDSPAEAAGFQEGDVLLALQGITLSPENKEALKKAKASFGPGSAVSYTVARGNSKQKIAVTLGHVPDVLVAQWIGEHMIDQHAYVRVASN